MYMSILKYICLVSIIFFISNCSSTDETIKNEESNNTELTIKEVLEKKVIPEKITMLFVSQPYCPSCKRLEKVMNQGEPKKLIEAYFEIKKVQLGDEIPATLMPPNGTPTVYFLGSNDEVLVEPIVGEKSEAALMEFLNDSIYEYQVTYGVDIRKTKEENNETTISKTDI